MEDDDTSSYRKRYSKEELENPVRCNLSFMGYRSYSATDDILEDTTTDFLKKWLFQDHEIEYLDECEIIGSNPLIAIKSAKK
uniref:Uncharacterized protein n=1 Tax=Marseillevirus LCMAC101 TaxID=2506602 RepID=A0A481YRJ4_9VIRU|nr:MAG: hypothetical protein LCMAC101_04070 [Marseillevirus LCMAC101]